MRTGIVAAVATVLIAGSSFAQQIPPPAGTPAISPEQSGPQSTIDRQNIGREGRSPRRLQWLKQSLHLTADQEKNWTAYEAAFQDTVDARRRMREVVQQSIEAADPIQAIRQRAQALGNLSTALSRIASAQEPLYNSLDPTQKREFSENAPRIAVMGLEERGVNRRDRDEERFGRWRDRDRDEDRFGRWRSQDENRLGRWRERDHDEDRFGRWRGRDRNEDSCGRRGFYHSDRRSSWRDRDYDDRDPRDRDYHHRRGHEDDDDR
jgi:LTXXQ motif family protein